jgi:hypothetical protein
VAAAANHGRPSQLTRWYRFGWRLEIRCEAPCWREIKAEVQSFAARHGSPATMKMYELQARLKGQ